MSFTHPVRVYWEDTDAGGIVFYANYLKFFERARTEWLRALGIGQGELRERTGGMFIVGETSVRYLRPARLDDELLVTAHKGSGGLLAEGTIRIGWVDAATLKPGRIPPAILETLNR
jgi:acyl-CoA thioester hydrolase